MNLNLVLQIRNDKNLDFYLKTHSYWYKILRRDPLRIREMNQEMRKEYKLTSVDKLNQISSKIQMVRTFLDVLN